MQRAFLAAVLGGVLLTGAACGSDAETKDHAAPATPSAAPASSAPDYSADNQLICGKIEQLYNGGRLGHTGYVRNREMEFGQTSGTRASIYAELDAAIAIVGRVLPDVSDATLDQDFPEPVMGSPFRTGTRSSKRNARSTSV